MTTLRSLALAAGAALTAAAAMLLGPAATRPALAGTPRSQQVVTTQRAVVAPEAFKPNDPVMQSPQAAKALSATLVSAKFENTPAMEAFAELTKKTGYVIEPYDSGGTNQTKYGRVTATITNQPFWFAVREICTRGNLSLYYYGDNEPDKIQLMPSNYGQQHAMKAPVSIQGPYMTVLNHLDRVNNVNMAAPDKVDRRVNLQIHTFAEPKARPTQYAYQPVVDEAIDDHGNSMVPDAGDRQSNMQSARGVSFYGSVQLKYPTTNPGTRIARVRGHIDAKVQLQSEPWEIADPLKAAEQSKTFGDKKVTFKRLSRSGDGHYALEFVFHRGDNEDQQAFQQNAFRTEPVVKLSDASGGRYQSYSSGGRGDANEVTRQFALQRRDSGARRAAGESPDAAEPNKLVLEIPTAVQDVAIPFELVDLPLP
jgi:hypothetical protein